MKRVERNLISIELPDNWELWDQNIGGDVQLAAKVKSGKWPNIEITEIGKVPYPNAEKTKEFAHTWLRKQRATLISERFLKVTGRDAYEFCYYINPFLNIFGSRKYFCKVSVIRFGIEYLIQLSSKDFEEDKPLFDKIVSSMRFEFATEIIEMEEIYDKEDDVQRLEEHQSLLELCKEEDIGIDDRNLLQIIVKWVESVSWKDSKSFLTDNKEEL